ncbi:hypothetical protein [Pseudochryseolinea flava]|uniref:DUF4595 domain-containing protein n=1 Tax=Pseudochryseolinea flava TaxID=2059302 RepID=A0A364Y832_9BACT|nr:hypothetical protein [Pseudochryseolinea flava]RAW02294.1 hypothetical protein DQQ10_07095 [Pseudochryseolinea flava]
MRKIILQACLIAVWIPACKDDDDKKAEPPACRITVERSNMMYDPVRWEYEYDDKGNPSRIRMFNERFNFVVYAVDVYYDGVIRTDADVVNPKTILKTSYDADIFRARPSKANLSITIGSHEQVNWKTFFFFYDSKGRVIKIGEQTDHLPDDYEWDLDITYNDDDNVTMLKYEWTTGPRDPIAPTTVAAYDDHPTPYAGVNSWKFLTAYFSWDNYDPEPILTALSRNNPLDYKFGVGESTFERKMAYEYNEHGFPTKRLITNKNTQGEIHYEQTFQYDCP